MNLKFLKCHERHPKINVSSQKSVKKKSSKRKKHKKSSRRRVKNSYITSNLFSKNFYPANFFFQDEHQGRIYDTPSSSYKVGVNDFLITPSQNPPQLPPMMMKRISNRNLQQQQQNALHHYLPMKVGNRVIKDFLLRFIYELREHSLCLGDNCHALYGVNV